MTPCPSREQFERLLNGHLQDEEEQSLDAHVKSCADCLKMLEELTAVSPQALRDSGLFRLPVPAQENNPRWDEAATVFIRRLQERILPGLIPDPASTRGASRMDDGEVLPQVPGYHVLGLLGRGGMGVVYKAEQLGLNRIVALKMIRSNLPAGSQARFRTEVTAVARLQHPNIVQIFEVGDWQASDAVPPMPYYSLEYVEGGSLADKLAGLPQPPGHTAYLVELIARAVHFAHERGILHRDLKPANILLTAEGAPKIADFGLAKLLEGGSDCASHTGDWIQGTPCYMAPEQASPGRSGGPIGTAADVYALGAILYEMLTGRPPFRSQTPLETTLQVLHTEPTAPRRFRLDLSRDLETICLKCLAKDPARRYASALELAEDLRRFQAKEPIQARPISRAERLWRWCRRNPVNAALLATLAVVVIAAFSLVTWKWRDEVRAAAIAIDEKEQADRARNEVERLSARALVDLAINQGDHGNIDRALLLLAKSLELADRGGNPKLDRAIRINLAAWHSRFFRRRATLTHDNWVWAVAYSPDGKWCATASRDKTARLWDTVTGEPVSEPLRHKYPVWTVAFSPDSKTLLTGSGDEKSGEGEILLWEVPAGKPFGNPLQDGNKDIRFVTKVAFSNDGKTIVVAAAGEVHVCKRNEDKILSCFTLPHTVPTITVALSPDAQNIVTGGADGVARLWDADTGKPIGQPFDHNPTGAPIRGQVCQVTAATFSLDGQLVLTGTQVVDVNMRRLVGGEARLWRVRTGAMVGKPWPHAGPLKTVVFSPDGTRALTGAIALKNSKKPGQIPDLGGEARLWDVATGNPLTPSLKQRKPVWAVAFSKDGRTLLTGNEAGDVQFWLAATGTPLFSYQHGLGNVNAVVFSPDGRTALSTRTYDQGSAMLWEVPPASGDLAPFVREPGVKVFAFAPDGTQLATGNAGGAIRLWNLEKRNSTDLLPRLKNGVNALAFSPDGAVLAGGGADKNIQLWGPTGKSLGQLGPQEGVLALAFSPGGKMLLSGGHSGKTVLWDLTSNKPLSKPPTQSSWVHALAFHPDRKKILVGNGDGFVHTWDLPNYQPAGELIRHQKGVTAIVFSPDGKTLATAGDDHIVSLWDAASGQPLWPPLQHDRPLQTAVFSPDGTMLLTGSEDGIARLWDVPTGLRLGPMLMHRGPVLAAFRPKSKQIGTMSDDGLLRLWDVPAPVAGDIQHIQHWVESLTAKRLAENGVLQDFDGPALRQLRQQ